MVSFTHVTLILGVSAVALAGAAPQVADSPQGVTYEAVIDSALVQGKVQFTSTSKGQIQVDVDITELPLEGGPFIYHVHQLPVPSDGNCTGTLDHLNPYGGSPKNLDAADKEVGDLSGKHGAINGTSLQQTYIDTYLSLNKNDPAFFGNLSVVVHFANATRIGCGNITAVGDSAEVVANSSTPFTASAPVATTTGSTGGGLYGGAATTAAPKTASTNAAMQNAGSGVLLGAAVAGFALLY